MFSTFFHETGKGASKRKIIAAYCLSAFLAGTALAHNGPSATVQARQDGPVINQPRFTDDIVELDESDINPPTALQLINQLRLPPKTPQDKTAPAGA
jgi:hypothetical protein